MRKTILGSHTSIVPNYERKNKNIKAGCPVYFLSADFLDSLDFILSALPFLITPFFAALSTIEKALAKFSAEKLERTKSIAVLALVFVVLLI